MPSKNTSPYASTFKSAIKRGTPCSVAVNSIANRTKKSPTVIFNSLFKAGLCWRQKFNGQWVYWAVDGKKTNATTAKNSQWNMWQNFIDWSIASGYCTPKQLNNHTSSQNEFMSFCKKFFGRQVSASTTSKTTKGRKTRKSSTTKARKSTASKARKSPAKAKSSVRKSRSSTPKSFKFPTVKSRTSTRRFRKAA